MFITPKRPLSWSAISSFEYNPEEWYNKYILNIQPQPNKEMVFGKKFAKSCEDRKPMAPVTLLSHMEYPLSTTFNGIPLIGYIDSYEPHEALREYKTGKNPWTQEKADNHGQIDMYALQLFIQHQVKPEDLDIVIEWVPTKENGDFTISLVDPVVVHKFPTKRTMSDILRFGARINNVVKEMGKYAAARSVAIGGSIILSDKK